MPKRIFILLMLWGGLIFCTAAPVWAQTESQETNIQNLQQSVTGNITRSQNAQAEIDRALESGANAMELLKTKKDDLRWTEYQITKYKQYIAGQRERIEELERQKAAMYEIQRALEPYLDETCVLLAEFVQNDLPFMKEERQARLDALYADLNDHRLSLADKTSRLLDVLRTENNYAIALNTQNVVLDLPGGPVNVRLLSLGRLALYYQTDDGSQSGFYNKATASWTPMTLKAGKDLTQALQIVDKRSVPALVNLPVKEDK